MSPKYLAEKHRNDDPHWPTKLVPQYSIKTPHNNAPLQDAHTHTHNKHTCAYMYMSENTHVCTTSRKAVKPTKHVSHPPPQRNRLSQTDKHTRKTHTKTHSHTHGAHTNNHGNSRHRANRFPVIAPSRQHPTRSIETKKTQMHPRRRRTHTIYKHASHARPSHRNGKSTRRHRSPTAHQPTRTGPTHDFRHSQPQVLLEG